MRASLQPQELSSAWATSRWVGNLDVRFDSHPDHVVEAHRALDLEVATGQLSIYTIFPDAPQYHVSCGPMEDGWEIGLLDPLDTTSWRSIATGRVPSSFLDVIEATRSGGSGRTHGRAPSSFLGVMEANLTGYCHLVVLAPAEGQCATQTTTFTREPDGKSVTVDFSFQAMQNPRPCRHPRLRAARATVPGVRVFPPPAK